MENSQKPIGPNTSKVAEDAVEIETPFDLGRFAPYQREKSQYNTAIRLFWGRIALWLLVLGVFGWLTATTALFTFIKYQRGFSEVQFKHILFLPLKLSDYRKSKGEFLIKEGLAKAQQQEWRKAFDLLRTGLLAVPEHREARLMVARLYLMANRPDITRTTLLDGLRYQGDHVEYVQQVLEYFFSLQADDLVIEVTTELKVRLDPQSPAMRMVNIARAYAYFNLAKYAETQATLVEARLTEMPEARFLNAKIAWEQGKRSLALSQLRELTAQVPQDLETYRTLISFLSEEKRWAEVARASWLRQLALPEQPLAYLDFIEACAKDGDTARQHEAEAAFIERFKGNSRALLTLAEAAAHSGRLDVTQRVEARCRELGQDEIDAGLLVLRAQLENGAYKAVIEHCIDLGQTVLKWPERQRLVLGGLRAVALYGLNQDTEAEPLVRRLWESRGLGSTVLMAFAVQVERLGRRGEARRLAQQAVALEPLNQSSLVFLLRNLLSSDELQEAPALIGSLLKMRKPPKELLEALSQRLGSDRYIFLPERQQTQAAIAEFLAKTR